MLVEIAKNWRNGALGAVLVLLTSIVAVPTLAQQVETVDPDLVIDGDLDGAELPAVEPAQPAASTPGPEQPTPRYNQVEAQPVLDLPPESEEVYPSPEELAENTAAADAAAAGEAQTTYGQDDLIGAAEGLFGQGAEGLARMIENILEEQGEPSAYVVGREGGGAFIVGLRYGSGTLHHAVEGNQPIYWTGPSIGLDAGANAGNTFVLVYNLYDTEELYERFPSGEGQAYLVGGFHASYMRKGDIVLIPIRVGAGLRLGVNAGYMKFSHRQRWLPF